MPRPIKCRKINPNPSMEFFKPAEISSEHLQQVRLTIGEYEAVHLAALEGLHQEQAAEQLEQKKQFRHTIADFGLSTTGADGQISTWVAYESFCGQRSAG